jgi:hypothetical protein
MLGELRTAELLAKARVLDARPEDFSLIETMRHQAGRGVRSRPSGGAVPRGGGEPMEEEPEGEPGGGAEGVPLIEGWMIGALLFEKAMAVILRTPPANDQAPPAEG